MHVEGKTQPVRPADIGAAALYLAKLTRTPTNRESLQRWQTRIRQWANRYPNEVRRYGRSERRGVYDLAELEPVARRVVLGQVLTP